MEARSKDLGALDANRLVETNGFVQDSETLAPTANHSRWSQDSHTPKLPPLHQHIKIER